MTDDTKYFEDARALFMQDGWAEYVKELELAVDGSQLDACNTAEEFWKAKGKLAGLRLALSYEDRVKSAEEQYDA
jgi:hypothetical protein